MERENIKGVFCWGMKIEEIYKTKKPKSEKKDKDEKEKKETKEKKEKKDEENSNKMKTGFKTIAKQVNKIWILCKKRNYMKQQQQKVFSPENESLDVF